MIPSSASYKSILLLLATAAVVPIESAKDSQSNQLNNLDKIPEYPGRQVYLNVERYLEEKVNSRGLEVNLRELKHLSDELSREIVKPARAINAARLLLAMDELLEANRCDVSTAAVLELNLKASEELGDGSRVSNMTMIFLSKLAARCETSVAERLNKALQAMPKRQLTYDRLRWFINEQFLADWRSYENRQLGLKVDQMNVGLNWTAQPYLTQGIILGRLVEASDSDESIVGWRLRDEHRSVYQHYSPNRWPKLTRAQLKALVRKYIIRPCAAYLEQVDKNILRLFYLAGEHLGADSYGRAFMGRQTADTKAELFRYEFCHLDQAEFVKELWQSFRKRVYPNMKFTD